MYTKKHNLKRCLNPFNQNKPCGHSLRKVSKNFTKVLTIKQGWLCHSCRKLANEKVRKILGKKTRGNGLVVPGGKYEIRIFLHKTTTYLKG